MKLTNTTRTTALYGRYFILIALGLFMGFQMENARAQDPNSYSAGGGDIEGTWCLSIGYGSYSGGAYTSAYGAYAFACDDYDTALGQGAYAAGGGFGSVAINGAFATGAASIGINGAYAYGEESVAIGDYAIASGGSSTAVGTDTTATGDGSSAFGFLTTAVSDYTTAVGVNNAVESYPSDPSKDPLFVIGNGFFNSWTPSNALTVYKNGNTNINGRAKITGGLVVTGTMVSGICVATGTNTLVLIPQQGDLSMGSFTSGQTPQ